MDDARLVTGERLLEALRDARSAEPGGERRSARAVDVEEGERSGAGTASVGGSRGHRRPVAAER